MRTKWQLVLWVLALVVNFQSIDVLAAGKDDCSACRQSCESVGKAWTCVPCTCVDDSGEE
jgi:hypothetical protein